jgi:hypothetical protein
MRSRREEAMSLSVEEWEKLQRIEERLVARDPRLARAFGEFAHPTPRRRWFGGHMWRRRTAS